MKKNYRHEAVNHSAGEYIKGQAHTNGNVRLSCFKLEMGRKPKIIPHIPGTLDSIAEAIFAKNKAKKTSAKKSKKRK